MIRLDHVSKTYPKGTRPALNDVNVEISKGEFVFLVGTSGSGKSTFLRLLLREDTASTGAVHVLGKDVAKLSNFKVPALRRQVSGGGNPHETLEIDAVNRRGRQIQVRVTVSPFSQPPDERSGAVVLMDPTDR